MRMGGPGGMGGPVSLLDMPDIPRPDEMARSEYPFSYLLNKALRKFTGVV